MTETAKINFFRSVACYKFYDREKNQEIRGINNFKYNFVDYGCKWTNYLLIIDYRHNPRLLHFYILREIKRCRDQQPGRLKRPENGLHGFADDND